MRIQHNIMAMNAYRNYNINTSAVSKNLEKLSSGYKINRAGDDAAGLAISEKMRAQITGLDAATKNVKDGISLVKTAEGAMQEIQDMLNRMDYLATQSANGTYDNDVDRTNLQKEVTALKSEINRIADSANFNGIKLLDGSLDTTTASSMTDAAVSHQTDANPDAKKAQKGIYSIDLKDFKAASSTNAAPATISIKIGGVTVAQGIASGTGGFVEGDAWKATTGVVTIGTTGFDVSRDGDILTITMKTDPTGEFNTSLAVTVDAANGAPINNKGNAAFPQGVTVVQQAQPAAARVYAQCKYTLNATDVTDGFQLKIGKETYTFAVGANSKFKNAANVIDLTDREAGSTNIEIFAARRLTEVAKNNKMFKVGTENSNGTITITEREGAGIDYTKNNLIGTDKNSYTDADAKAWNGLIQTGKASATAQGLQLQIGDTADNYNQLGVSVGDMHTKAMGIADIDISNQASAQSAIQTVRDAINYVSGVRGDLGAVQNRLEHTQNNLSVMKENIQDAESTIRDTDIAEEMMAYTKNNILVQSAQAMLAQANQIPQGVLQLLG